MAVGTIFTLFFVRRSNLLVAKDHRADATERLPVGLRPNRPSSSPWVVRQTSATRVPFGIEHNGRRAVSGNKTACGRCGWESASYQRK